jgi:hypothetical protein
MVGASATLLAVKLSASAASLGMAFYGDPPDQHHPWAVHDQNRPQPAEVTPGTPSTQDQPGKPPSDAIILFDGKDLSKWKSMKEGGGPAQWVVKDGVLEVAPSKGDICTKEEFGDCQLHVEWTELENVKGSSQGRGNSGIFLEGVCEVQVLDSYHNLTYADGHAGAVYGINPPMVNPIRPPGQFQVYDIIFRRPIYKDNKLVDEGYMTVIINGVVVQDHTILEGAGGHMKRSVREPFPAKGPLKLQDHGNPVRFRNIWYRPLPPRPSQGGTDGELSTEATMAKRKEIAAEVRADAAKLTNPADPVPQLLRLMESLVYENDPATVEKVQQLSTAYFDSLKQLPADRLQSKKDQARQVNHAFDYVVQHAGFPANSPAKAELAALIKAQRWDKK